MKIPLTVSFGEDPIAPPVDGVTGLDAAEGWGRWSNDTRVSIRFDSDLPEVFEAHVACAVSSANIGRVITVIAGNCTRKFVSTKTLRDGLEVARLRFHVGDAVRSMEFLIPDAAPEGGLDVRSLGLALGTISIVPAAEAANA